jgi:hypothetical protein
MKPIIKKGRKPISDKKQPVTVFIPASAIKKHGGKEKVKEKIRDYIVATALILICLLAENFMP